MDTKKTLARYGIKQTEDGHYRSVMPSRFSEDYYQNFHIRRLPPISRFPFKLPRASSHHPAAKELSKQEKVSVDYKQEADFFLVYQQLSELTREVLLFIGTFRHVQKYQIQREVGPAVSGKRLDKALKILHKYFLIEAWEFPRQDKPGASALAYSITGNGSKLLSHLHLLKGAPTSAISLDLGTDNCQPVRFWKIVDTYQMMKASAHYKSFRPQKNFASKPYKIEFIEERKNALGQEQKIKKEKLIYLRPLQLKGELVFENPRLQYVFDLYPIVTEEDEEDLQLLLQHWEKQSGDYSYLVIIVDSWEKVEELHSRYSLAEGVGEILFFDLECVQKQDLLSSLYQYDSASQSYQVLPFRLVDRD